MSVAEVNRADPHWKRSLLSLDDLLESVILQRISIQNDAERTESESLLQQFAGVYIDPSTVLRFLRQSDLGDTDNRPKTSLSEDWPSGSQWKILATRLSLSTFECGVLLLAFAAEIHTKYERIFAYLNDDLTRKRPTLGLAFELFGGPNSVTDQWDSFDATGKLQRFALLEVLRDDGPRLSWPFRLTWGGFRRLSDKTSPDPMLEPNLVEIPVLTAVNTHALRLPFRELEFNALKGSASRFVVSGPSGVGKSTQIAAMARELELTGISLDVDALASSNVDRMRQVGGVLVRDAYLYPTLVHLICNEYGNLACLLDGRESTSKSADYDPDSTRFSQSKTSTLVELRRALRELPRETKVAVETRVSHEAVRQLARVWTEFQVIPIGVPGTGVRQNYWSRCLQAAGWDAASSEAEANSLASAFRFGFGQIEAAVRDARFEGLTQNAVWNAAQARASGRMDDLAERIQPHAQWTDLVITDVEREQLRDLIRRVRHRNTVIEDWGFGRKLGHGTGVNALFAGPPGTGKTMAAEVLAGELRVPLYRVECSSVISKYIGETEKNLERIFSAAQSSDALIFFDEADAIFGKRTEVSDAHDRYANIETAYLLQRLERHEGIVVMATNFLSNIDSAFIRRVTQVVHFKSPDEMSRRRIWQNIWPVSLPLDHDVEVNLDGLARRYEINGGSIKNVALTAAFLASADKNGSASATVRMEHVVAALGQEYRKLGRISESFNWRRASDLERPRNGGHR